MKNVKNVITILFMIFGITTTFASNTLETENLKQSQINETKPEITEENQLEIKKNIVVQKIIEILNNQQSSSDDELEQIKQFFANTLKDAWTGKKKIKIEKEDLKNLNISIFEFEVENSKKLDSLDSNDKNLKSNFIKIELCTIEDVYKTKILSLLFPNFEKELSKINLNERKWESSYEDEDGNYYSTYSYIYVDLPIENIEQASKEAVEKFNSLSQIKQLQVLSCWIYQQIFYDNI
ncbi:hypothetical protein KAT08_04700 [Candidatus Babeliales bacterium]|nr:hypothetical protein [Candidatus Babeliales bacterium]